jgi:hypothetical protein
MDEALGRQHADLHVVGRDDGAVEPLEPAVDEDDPSPLFDDAFVEADLARRQRRGDDEAVGARQQRLGLVQLFGRVLVRVADEVAVS